MEQVLFSELQILVVDDDRDFLDSFSFYLGSNIKGIRTIDVCEDGSKVLAMLSQNNYTVIFLDLKMTPISGEELLEKIVEQFPCIPVIMLTAHDEVEPAVNCVKKGAFDYLRKPTNAETLTKTIHNAIEANIITLTKIPYYYGCYITDLASFYGRKEQLSEILQKIGEAENDKFWHISIIGDYRQGKSSLLKRTEYEIESKTNSISVYIDLSAISQEHFTKSVVNKIIDSLFSRLDDDSLNKIKKIITEKKYAKLDQFGLGISIIGLFSINFNPKKEDHWEQFFNALDNLIEKARTNPTRKFNSIVLILDEITAITRWNDFREVLSKLRALAQRTKGLNLLVGSAYPLYQLSKDEWSPFFNIFEQIKISELTDEEAEELIKNPAKEVGIYYTPDSINLIKDICGKKPYYIQVLCRVIFEKLHKKKKVSRTIESYMVNSAIEDVLEQLNSHFSQIFHKCTSYQRELLNAIAQDNKVEYLKLASDCTKREDKNNLLERALIYKSGNELTTDGLFKKWIIRE